MLSAEVVGGSTVDMIQITVAGSVGFFEMVKHYQFKEAIRIDFTCCLE